MSKTMKSRVIYFIISGALLTVSVNAQFTRQVNKVGTTAAMFLEFGVGSRALAMGEASVTQAGDISAAYWNPAGLADIDHTDISFYQAPWIADILFSNAILGVPVGAAGTMAVFVTSVTMDEMVVRTVAKPDGTGELFTATNYALGASYARHLTDRFRVGATAKLVHEQIWHMGASTIAFDIGTLFTTANRGLNIGMSISNFGSKMRLDGRDTQVTVDVDEEKSGNNDRIAANLDTWSYPLPLIFRVGLSTAPIQIGQSRLVLAVDAIQPNNQYQYVNVGFEYSLGDLVYLRAGHPELFLEQSERGLTLGGGIRYRLSRSLNFTLDYVHRDLGRLGLVEGYTLGMSF